MLRTRDLRIGHGGRALLSDLALAAAPGTFTCVLGRNGVGKSTLLRTLAGLQPPLHGQVLLEGDDVHRLAPQARARRLAVVLTERAAAGALRVEEAVALGRLPHTDWLGRRTQEDDAAVAGALADVGAEALRGRLLGSLSDGERQRVMVARALAQQPALLVLDEVTAFLDLPGRVAVMSRLRELARRRRMCVLLSSHDLDLSLQFADVLWVLDRQGRMSVGLPEDLVLGGVIAEAFDSEHARFDLALGGFNLVRSCAGPSIAVAGEDPERQWTERALVRLGHTVSADDGARIRIRVRTWREADGPRWRLDADDARARQTRSAPSMLTSIAQLADALHRVAPTGGNDITEAQT